MTTTTKGPLHGIKVLEIGGIGPNPFAGMLLADMGADVLRVDRKNEGVMVPPRFDVTKRGRAAIGVDLKHEQGRALLLDLCASADALIEGFRPGVMERLGLGPDVVLERNPRLVYGRMTGWGQEGPLAPVAGHDINYISIAGALGASKRAGEKPMFALNLVGDYGGGAMFLAFGVVCAIVEARTSGAGQVVDAAMVDGVALLTSLVHGLRAAGAWTDEPGTNLLDTGAHFYDTYTTSDGAHMAVGALEPQFYAKLLELTGIDPDEMPQYDRERWPEFKERLAAVFATRTRDEWTALFEHEDACVTPVLQMNELPAHYHNAARQTFLDVDGVTQPNAAPRFSRTPGAVRPLVEDTPAVLAEWGVDATAQDRLRTAGALV